MPPRPCGIRDKIQGFICDKSTLYQLNGPQSQTTLDFFFFMICLSVPEWDLFLILSHEAEWGSIGIAQSSCYWFLAIDVLCCGKMGVCSFESQPLAFCGQSSEFPARRHLWWVVSWQITIISGDSNLALAVRVRIRLSQYGPAGGKPWWLHWTIRVQGHPLLHSRCDQPGLRKKLSKKKKKEKE